eukprot:15444971-Alexandrium_andersonii.AAC.1
MRIRQGLFNALPDGGASHALSGGQVRPQIPRPQSHTYPDPRRPPPHLPQDLPAALGGGKVLALGARDNSTHGRHIVMSGLNRGVESWRRRWRSDHPVVRQGSGDGSQGSDQRAPRPSQQRQPHHAPR